MVCQLCFLEIKATLLDSKQKFNLFKKKLSYTKRVLSEIQFSIKKLL